MKIKDNLKYPNSCGSYTMQWMQISSHLTENTAFYFKDMKSSSMLKSQSVTKCFVIFGKLIKSKLNPFELATRRRSFTEWRFNNFFVGIISN